VYFRLGQGKDYVYHGATEFRGIHKHDVLQLTKEQKDFFAAGNRKDTNEVKDLFPEYYILCVEDFDDTAQNSLDEWLYYFKNNTIPAGFTAAGLQEARKQLQYDKLSAQDKIDYDYHLDQQLYERGAIETAIFKGEAIGFKKGEAKGRVAERTEVQENVVIKSHLAGLPVETISTITGLTPEQIAAIIKKHKEE
jgi:flagellar biosynthesis/type III secretory pathway protein FliH